MQNLIIKVRYYTPSINELEGTEFLQKNFKHILFNGDKADAWDLTSQYFDQFSEVQEFDILAVYKFKDGYHFDEDIRDTKLNPTEKQSRQSKPKKIILIKQDLGEDFPEEWNFRKPVSIAEQEN